MEGMQEKFGATRVSDTGIESAPSSGKVGMAMRGLRPIAEIQYLDYLYYALQLMRDDLATVRYRTAGGQKAPLIVRTRGHRLEGIWHSGSPMGAIVHSVRGMRVRATQHDPGRRDVQHVDGGRRAGVGGGVPQRLQKEEPCPSNLGDFRVPLGQVEVLREGQT